MRDLPTPVSHEVRLGENHLTLPWPAEIFIDNPTPLQKMPWEVDRVSQAKPPIDNMDMFGKDESKSLYVAVEYERYKISSDRWQRAFNKTVSYSTSLGGIKKALKFWWQHRLDTRELTAYRDEQHLRDECKIAVFQVMVNDHDQRLKLNHPEGVFTWQSDKQPLDVIRNTFHTLEHILFEEGLKQEAKMGTRKVDRELAEESLAKLNSHYGEIVWSQVYEPPMEAELTEDIDITTAPVVCNTCSR